MSAVHASAGRLPPASEHLLSEVEIVCRLALATLDDSTVPWSTFAADYTTIRAMIADVVPGFEDYEERVTVPGGFTLPHAPRDAGSSTRPPARPSSPSTTSRWCGYRRVAC